MTWVNNDGLIVKFGTEEAIPARIAEYRTDGDLRVLEATFDLEDVTASAQVLSDTVRLPLGAVVEKIEVVVLEIADGASAVLDVGTSQMDYTEYDYDGLIDGMTEAALDDTEGATYTFLAGSTSIAGGNSGTDVGDFNGFTETVMVTVMTADANLFTAGRIKLRIYYSKPHALTKELWT